VQHPPREDGHDHRRQAGQHGDHAEIPDRRRRRVEDVGEHRQHPHGDKGRKGAPRHLEAGAAQHDVSQDRPRRPEAHTEDRPVDVLAAAEGQGQHHHAEARRRAHGVQHAAQTGVSHATRLRVRAQHDAGDGEGHAHVLERTQALTGGQTHEHRHQDAGVRDRCDHAHRARRERVVVEDGGRGQGEAAQQRHEKRPGSGERRPLDREEHAGEEQCGRLADGQHRPHGATPRLQPGDEVRRAVAEARRQREERGQHVADLLSDAPVRRRGQQRPRCRATSPASGRVERRRPPQAPPRDLARLRPAGPRPSRARPALRRAPPLRRRPPLPQLPRPHRPAPRRRAPRWPPGAPA
jgi:hypothetical protein